MRLPKLAMPVIALVIFWGSVAVANAMGWWIVGVDVNNLTSPQEIRGWMTIQQVSDQFGLPMEVLYQQLAIPPDIAPTTPIRDMEKQVEGFEVDKVRQVVTNYLNERTPTPQPTTP